MALLKEEMETTINWNQETLKATIESPLKSMWTKLEKMGAVHLMDYKFDGVVTSKVFEIPAPWVHIYPPKEVSDKTKQRLKRQAANKARV